MIESEKMLEPSEQLQEDLLASVVRSLNSRRPLLHHLNADTSWLLQIPRPLHEKGDGKRYYNLLIDPWLSGSQSDVASWFSQQWHASVSAVPSIGAVEALISEIESISNEVDMERQYNSWQRQSRRRREEDREKERTGLIDVVAISHEFTDHCHEATLLELSHDVPVIAATKAAQLVKSWGHFDTVIETPVFTEKGANWRHNTIGVLPDWLSIMRVVDQKDQLYYHSAILIAFQPCPRSSNPSSQSSKSSQPEMEEPPAELVIYTPHGIHFPSLSPILTANPPVRTLAFLHGLHDVTISGKQLNLGAHNAIAGRTLLNAKYWIGTHDEVKPGGGLASWFIRRKVISVEDAVRAEALKKARNGFADASEANGVEGFLHPKFAELANGESMVLA